MSLERLTNFINVHLWARAIFIEMNIFFDFSLYLELKLVTLGIKVKC